MNEEIMVPTLNFTAEGRNLFRFVTLISQSPKRGMGSVIYFTRPNAITIAYSMLSANIDIACVREKNLGLGGSQNLRYKNQAIVWEWTVFNQKLHFL
jgi:hypothetical protein